MLAAHVISGQVDHALGYTRSDMGPPRIHNPLLRATRVQTLAISSTLMIGLSLLLGSLVLAGAVGIMDMDASLCAIAVVGIGGLGLSPLSVRRGCRSSRSSTSPWPVPTSGATVTLQAISGFFRALCEFEPLRQITGIVCPILSYDVQGYAGLTRGRVMLGARLVVARLFGFG